MPETSVAVEPPDAGSVRTRKEFADALTALRNSCGLTVRQVAAKANAPGAHSTIGDWFAGRALPSASSQDLFERVLTACGVTDSSVLGQWIEVWRRVRRAPGPRPAGMEPYRGLASFEPGDAGWFFGRDALTASLVACVADLHTAGGGVQIVIGPSGSGKSSLLRAGLIPALRTDAIPGASGWTVELLTPGARPVDELAARLSTLASATAGELADLWRVDPMQAAGLVRADLRRTAQDAALSAPPEDAAGGQHRLVLVVDQFEELFTQCDDPDERNAFIDALVAIGSPGLGGALVVLGLRADFYGHALRFPQLAETASSRQLPVGPMNEIELRQAIEKPAQKARIDLEPGLVELLLRDVSPPSVARSDGGALEAGVLPLLSHALYAMWRQAEGGRLSISDYQRLGGIDGAIGASASDIFHSLTPVQQELARRLFLTMVHVADGTADARRRVTPTDLLGSCADATAEEIEDVLELFIAQRLITADTGAVQISHEALLTAWPLLRAWLDTDRTGLVVARQLGDAAAHWRRDNRDPGALYSGVRLAVAREWTIEHSRELAPLAAEFLDVSMHEACRRSRRVYQVIAVLTVLTLLAAGLAGYAFQQRAVASAQRQEAVSQRNQAVSRLIALRANKLRDNDLSLARQLSLAAYQIAPTVEARSSLLDSYTSPGVTRIRAFSSAAQAVAFSPDKRILAAGSTNRTVKLWDVSDPQHPKLLATPLTGPELAIFSVAFSPDGRTIAAGSADGKVHRWDISTPTQPRTLNPLSGFGSTVYSVTFSPDGRTLAAGSADKTIRLWDISSPAQLAATAALTGPRDAVQAVAFSPDGRTLAAGSADTTVRLWNVTNPRQPTTLAPPLTGPTLSVYSLAFSPDGRSLAAGSADNTIRLWNITEPGQPIAAPTVLTGPTSWINALTFSPDGRSIAAGSSDNTITLWDRVTARVTSRLPHPSPVTGIAFGHDAHSLASSSLDGTVRLWTIPGPMTAGATGNIFSIAVSPDGHTLAEASRDETFRLWNVVNPRQPVLFGPPVTSPDKQTVFAPTIALHPDGKTLAIGTRTGPVQLWDITNRAQPAALGEPLIGPTKLVQTVAFSSDGKTLAAAGDDTNVYLWSIASPRNPVPLSTIKDTGSFILFLAFSPDAKTLAVSGADTQVHLWNVSSPVQPTRLAPPLEGASGYVNSVAFSPDGHTLATGSADRTIRLWNLTDPHKPVLLGEPLSGPNAKVFWLAFSPDGNRLAAAVTDGTVWIWDTSNVGQPSHYATLEAFNRSAYTLGFTPDGTTLAAAGADTVTRLWNLHPTTIAEWICSTAGDPITQEEWEQHVTGAGFISPCQQPR